MNRKTNAFICLVAIFTSLLLSCSPRIVEHIVEKEKVVYKDSVSYRDSVIRVPIPLEKNQVIVNAGDTSTLETSVAISTAYINRLGFLSHSLENKNTNLVVPIKFPTRYIFNGVTTSKTETVTKIEFRDKPLSWWNRFRLSAFWYLLDGLILSLLWIFRKHIKLW